MDRQLRSSALLLLLCAAQPQNALANTSSFVCQQTKCEERAPLIRWISSQDERYLCGGYYQEPLYDKNDSPLHSMDLPLVLSADTSFLTLQGTSSLIGHVTLKQGDRFLQADEAWLYRTPHTGETTSVVAKGHILLAEPGLQLEGQDAEIDFKAKKTWVENASFILLPKHAYGHADRISVNQGKVIVLKNAHYSTCTPNHPDWEIHADTIRLNRATGRGQASHVHLYVKNKPLLYFPYANFPIDKRRQSGFLFPSFGSSNQSGTTFSLPYYWNIASNYDAIVTPQHMTERGLQAHTFIRYLTKHQEGNLHLSFLPHDRQYETFRHDKLLSFPADGLANNDPRVLALNHGGARMALSWKNNVQWTNHWSGKVDYSWVSDDNYFIDLSNSVNVSNTNNLPQEVRLQYDGQFWHNFLKIQKFQTLHPYEGAIQASTYQRQPQFGFEMRDPNIWHHLQYGMSGDWVNFYHNRDPVTQFSFTKGSRIHVRPSLQYPLYRASGYWIPRVQLDYTQYNLNRGTQDRAYNRDEVIYRALPMFDSDAMLYFERSSHFARIPYQQTLEPRLYYVYIPRQNQNAIPNFDSGTIDFSYDQLFRPNRFSGYDRLGEANQLSFALTSRFLNKQHAEKFRLSLGQILYFKARDVSLCDQTLIPGCRLREDPESNNKTSAIAGFMLYHITPEWRLDNDLEWNPHQRVFDQNSVNLSYQGRNNRVLNLGYQYLRRDPTLVNLEADGGNFQLEQTDLSFAWPVYGQWRGIGRWHYDLTVKRSIDLLGGIEYNSCCIALQLVGSHYLRDPEGLSATPYANAIFIRILLKGLSTLGTSQEARNLSRDIPGFISFANTEYVKK